MVLIWIQKKILERLGYLVDTSITPMVSWKDQNGPSFLDYRANPFWFGDPKSSLLEVPVTIGLTKNISKLFEKIYLNIPKCTRIKGILSKDYLNLIDLVWIYPVLFSEKEMILLVDTLMKKSLSVFNVFFHSSEFKTGESLYSKTDEDVNKYFERLEIFLDYMVNKKNVRSVTLSGYRDLHKD